MVDRNNRIIIAGQLEFGSDRVYEQVVKQYVHRMENYYKNDILLKAEDIFQDEDRTMDIPRKVVESSDRQWLNTLNLLERMATFSIAGDLNLWRLQDGELLEHHTLEPRGDRTTTQLYIEGRKLLDRKENVEAAKEALTKAIDNFDRHSIAYERRGFTNYLLANFKDALYDYNKSIDISPSRPEPYYGRGVLYLRKMDNPAAAAEDFDKVAKFAIPHQEVYWLARAQRGDAFIQLGMHAEAQREYGFFLRRKQDIGKLSQLDRRVAFELAQSLIVTGKRKEANAFFENAIQQLEDKKAPANEEIQYYHAKNLRELGDKKWEALAKESAKAGFELAKELLSGEPA